MTDKLKLQPTAFPHIFETVDYHFEPLFARSIERGEVQFWHQSGYGYLPESRVEVLGGGGMAGEKPGGRNAA